LSSENIGTMYQFKIKELADGGVRFELNEIKMLFDGYRTDGTYHIINNPTKAIAYINNGDNLYGISNKMGACTTAEELYDAVTKQFQILKSEPLQLQKGKLTTNQDITDKQDNGLKRTA